jgi:hypothetical protein
MRKAIFFVVVALAGCYVVPNDDERFEEQVVATKYDPKAKFSSYATFTVSPVVDYLDASESEEVKQLDDALAKPLVSYVATQMKNLGYREVDQTMSPDLGLKLSVVRGTVVGVDYTPYWYWWGYPYYWGYYYPYDMQVAYVYDRTLLKVDMVDVNDLPPPGEGPGGIIAGSGGPGADAGTGVPSSIRALWTGVVYGLIDTNTQGELQDAQEGIAQAFKQSPYLRRTP